MQRNLFPTTENLPGHPAAWSPCRTYRYTLWRLWAPGSRYVQIVGLNPSTADEQTDDRTLSRCIGFAKRAGFDGMVMTNLFAYRETDRSLMLKVDEPIGPDNDAWLLKARAACEMCIVAWGMEGGHRGRNADVLKLLAAQGPLHCLTRTKDGHPGHPLYLKGSLVPVLFEVK